MSREDQGALGGQMGRRAKGLRAKKHEAEKKHCGTRKNDGEGARGKGTDGESLLLAIEKQVVLPTVYGGGVCVAPCVPVPSSLFLPLLSRSPGFSSMGKKSVPQLFLLSTFFFPSFFFYRSVAMIFPSARYKPANRSLEYFSTVSPFSSRDVRKDLTSVSFFCSSAGRGSRWKIYTPLERASSGIRGIVRSLMETTDDGDARIYVQWENG